MAISKHSAAIKSNGEGWTWGEGSLGQLGNNATDDKSTPVSVSGSHVFAAIFTGDEFSLGLKANGEVWSWGEN